ncbi:hypothetical protein JCM6882_006127 [Rhodosporidiobolus microsporus]
MQPPTDDYSLFSTSKDRSSRNELKLKAFVSVNGQPLQVHERRQFGKTVNGSVQAAVGQDFEIAFYDGRSLSDGPKVGYEVSVFFGKQRIHGIYNKPSHVKDRRSLVDSAEFRYLRWSDVRVGDNHIRKMRFSKVATTDEEEGACADADFLNNLSVLKLEYRRIKQAPRVKKTEEEKAWAKVQAKRDREARKNRPAFDPAAKMDGRMLSEKADKANFAIDPSFGELVETKVQKRTGKGSSSSWKYVYVDPDQVDLTFQFRIRSAAYIEKLYAEPEPEPEPQRATTPPVRLGKTLLIDFDDDEIEAAAAAAGLAVPNKDGDDEDEADIKEQEKEDESEPDSDDGDDGEGEGDEDEFTRPPSKKRRTDDPPRVKQEYAAATSNLSGGFAGPSGAGGGNGAPLAAGEGVLLAVKDEPLV